MGQVAKAKLPASAIAEVQLGAKTYAIDQHLLVPAGTSIKGVGGGATILTFTLSPPRRGEPNAAFEMVLIALPQPIPVAVYARNSFPTRNRNNSCHLR